MGQNETLIDSQEIADKNHLVIKIIGEELEQRSLIVRKEDAGSKAQPVDPLGGLGSQGEVIEPPLDLLTLSMLRESSTELGQCVDAMVVNISGFGGRLIKRKIKDKSFDEQKAELERQELEAFIENINPDDTLVDLRKKKREDLELTGNGYWELIPSMLNRDKIVSIKHIEAHTMRVCREETNALSVSKSYVDIVTGEVKVKKFKKRFRRFVQSRNGVFVYFKEYKDPRILDCQSGKYYADKKEAFEAGISEDRFANEIWFDRVYTARSPYGLPRYIGALVTILGSRKAEEINFKTFSNNLMPNMVITVSGNCMLTQGSINRLNEFWNAAVKKDANMSKLLILEAESQQEGLANSGTAKIEIHPMKDNQHDDAMFQDYDKNNADKIRRSFRLPPIYTGKAEDNSRSTAESSKRLAEEQVFSPEREAEDRKLTQFFLDMGYKYWVYKSYSPNVTDSKDLVSILSNTEKTGALTPNLAREVLSDILNREIEAYSDASFDGDMPFSLTMAEAVKAINPEQKSKLGGNDMSGKLSPNQGQIPAKISDKQEKQGSLEILKDDFDLDLEKIGPIIDKLDNYLESKTGFSS